MADYQRILSYLYRYEKSEKKECLGFIKAEQKSAILKLTIQINDERLLHGMKLKLCFYEKQGEHWGVRKLDSIITEEDKEEFHQMYSKEQLPEGFDIKKQSGVVLYYQGATVPLGEGSVYAIPHKAFPWGEGGREADG